MIYLIKEKIEMYWIKITIVILVIIKVIHWLFNIKKNQIDEKFKSHKYIKK